MPAPVREVGQAAPAQQGAAGAIPFVVGSNLYREAPFSVTTQQLDGNPHDIVANITPGGFLRGVTMQVTSASGVIGAGVLAADAPFSIFSSITLEDISGGPILYPMGGFSAFLCQKYFRPWAGDPSKRSDFSNTINPAFTLQLFPEIKDTLAVLGNTDARAQYRIRATLAPGNNASSQFGLTTTAPTTQPTVTVKLYLQTWAQPDMQDLLGNPISQVPDGVIASRFVMHEVPSLTAAANVIRATLVGNELRGLLLVVRNGNATASRVNLTDANAGPIDARLDNRRLWKMNQSQLVEEMQAFYGLLGGGVWSREAGVYCYSRFAGPADANDAFAGQGEYWLQTVEQTLLQFEFNGGDIANPPGTLEIIYDALAIAGHLSHDLEGA
jgi:hypothetical protein